MAKFFNAILLIGGDPNALDSIDGASLTIGDSALVVQGGELSIYHVTEGGTPPDESIPDVVEPDLNPGNKRWELGVTLGNYDSLPVTFFNALGLVDGAPISLDAIDGDLLTLGDVALVVVAGEFSVYQLTESGTAENLPGIVEPDNNPGVKRWELVVTAGSGGGAAVPATHIRARQGATQMLAIGSDVVMKPETVEHDALGEFDEVTGIFTALYDGWYNIHYQVTMVSNNYLTSNYMLFYIYKNNAYFTIFSKKWGDGLTMEHNYDAGVTVQLVAGDEVDVRLLQNHGNYTTNGFNGGNTLTIDRIG